MASTTRPPPVVPRFALNHMVAPRLDLLGFFDLASSLTISEVEIRNDLAGQAIADGTAPDVVRAAAAKAGVTVISINALQRFTDWTPAREREATDLADYAKASGARALVLVPVNDGSGCADGERQPRLLQALRALEPILTRRGVVGLIEPLGFETCSLRSKREAAEAIEAVGGGACFRLVHDTFHHALANQPELYPVLTGLIHVSGVADPVISRAEMRDSHRVLVDASDRLDTVGQITALLAAGYRGPLSFEPFAAEIHALAEPGAPIAASIDFIRTRLVTQAA